ncbi:hypothetical protein CC1G_02556 [Coprinopsis cinerea okayama7|uniref:Protein UNC80 C-terminal domain-containing protein n=1 Tax=Coprinopsis cinerea (strain Okayama-7 / 130 / ATCC MYA-4618 / FGSC 9003) TaxID=240176 RepID=A8NBU6_COPC7|nr:hypothetical protein CC1G_02556 [Coprinopsis cinerea okayama7\|eukprot:XP_001832294.2 hypothetical protein CC1G_02556 [Coprinopsis cinerea okayama7\
MSASKNDKEVKRSVPKRLFSFDNIKSPRSRRSSSEGSSSDRESWFRHGRTASKPSLSDVQEYQPPEAFEEFLARQGRVTSPVEDPFASRPQTPTATKYSDPIRQSPSLPARPKTPDSHRSASPSRRWDQLRQHVLPVAPGSRPSTPPAQVPRPASPASSRSGKTRLPKFGFRHVVDNAREANDNRKFAEDITRVCLAVRYPELTKAKSSDKDIQATIGGSVLPFMSTNTLGSGASTMHNTGATKKSDGKRPPSALSFPSVPKAASLKSLYQLLLYHSAPAPDTALSAYLPNEEEVLSCLLAPFLVPSRSTRWEEERTIALETFELLIKSWLPQDESSNVNRCLWCCKAALLPASPTRTLILSNLGRFIAPGERNKTTISLPGFQSICHHLVITLAFLHSPMSGPFHEGETKLLKNLIEKFISGSYGNISDGDVEETYGVVWLQEDTQAVVRRLVFLEALMRCLENSSQSTRVWLLLNIVEDYWPPATEPGKLTSLQMVIHSRKLNAFCKSASVLLQEQGLEPGEKHAVAQQIVNILRTRLIPETNLLDQTIALDCRGHISKVVFELLCLDNAREVVRWAISTLCRWLHDEDVQWRSTVDKTLGRAISEYPWPLVIHLLTRIVDQLPDPDRKTAVAAFLPVLNDRLVNDPPPYPNVELGNLLNSLSRLYPQIFFKPLFLCAASSKEFTVINHLCTLVIYSKFVTDFWWRDAEMMSIALMSDVGATKEQSSLPSSGTPWGVARLGQSILMVELIGRLQDLRRNKDASGPEPSLAIGKFLVALESRMSILLEAKEKTARIPPSQRTLLCMLFREFRLLTKSLKPVGWLHRTLLWFSDFFEEDDLSGDLDQEVTEAMERIHDVFQAARESAHQSQTRRSTILLATTQYERARSETDPKILDIGALFEERRGLIDGLLKGFASKAMKLFVAVSPLLMEDDYVELGSILWERCLDTTVDSPSTGPACFLLMQCAERATRSFLALIEVDLQSSDERTRLEAVRKIGSLINWRFQIMSQNFVVDRAHRPFKMARLPLPFVATDMGTTLYLPSEDASDSQESEIPTELRKQLAELGWGDDNAGPNDPQRERERTPMSLLPITQLEKMDFTISTIDSMAPTVGSAASPMPSPQPSPAVAPPSRRHLRPSKPDGEEGQTSLLRRSSTSGGPQSSHKRRAIFVPPLTQIFIRLSKLMYDPNFLVAAATRATLLDLMRNDPPLLTRPVMDMFAGEQKDIARAVATLSTYLHAHQVLPPPMSHSIFNNLMGFLKYAARQLDVPETLHEYALVLPVLASVITQVNGMSMREIRRSKTDPFVVPSGALWFADTAPKGPMFPRGFDDFANPFEDVATRILSTTMVRISQNLLFLAMLKRNSQDVTLVRKNASRLVLPSLSRETLEPRPLELGDMVPDAQNQVNPPESTLETFSLIFARSHLLLVAQVFRSMSRHLSDRNELALWIDGINKILCKHGHDIGIVGHALIALMVATTRFRRLFTSGTAYTLFMPALVKVYVESATHPGIRPAIEYAVNRFYALHSESFLFQALGVVGQMSLLPGIDEAAFSKSVYDLFFSLTKGSSVFTVDAAGIHNINKTQEREALIVNTAEEKPQTFLASLRRTDSSTQTTQLSLLFPDEYEAERLRMDNFVRLFLTVIAHDITIIRAQYYMRLLRLLTPSLFQASGSTRNVLVEGISALASILLKGGKIRTDAAPRSTDDYTLLPANMESHSSEQTRTQSDPKVLRMDYLQLVLSFGKAGGEISSKVSRQVIEIFKLVLKDSNNDSNKTLSAFLSDFVQTVLFPEHPPEPKAVVTFLRDLAPMLHAYMATIDVTEIFHAVHRLTLLPAYASNRPFSQVVVGEICTAGLATCELAASENHLQTLACRPALIQLIAECVFLEGADVIAEIEKRTPTYGFLAGVVLPLAIAMKTEAQINADGLRTQPRHRSVLASGWLRLLFYVIAACQKSTKVEGLQRSKSKDKNARGETAYLRSKLPVFVMALQILKIIVIRAEVDISSSIPGIWERIAAFLKAMLSDGNADFAVRQEIPSAFNSAYNSPTASPRVSAQYPSLDPSPSAWSHLSTMSAGVHFALQDYTFARPRVIDYMLWSVLEFLWAYRTPLRLQLRLLTTEKIVALDVELRKVQRAPNLSSPRRRPVSSIFSKVRNRGSGYVPSPDASPRLSPMTGPALLEPTPAFLDVRRPGYQVSPISPSDKRPYDGTGPGPQIIHLGPASPSAWQGPPSAGLPGGGGMRTVVRSVKIKSLKLAEATYRRIRGVQALMGYDPLLPLPGQGPEVEDGVVLKTWTMSQALTAINQETMDLLEEFEQAAAAEEDDDDDLDAVKITIEAAESDTASVSTLLS